VRIKPVNVHDVVQGQGPHDDETNYHKSKPLLLDRNDDYDSHDDLEYVRTNLAPIKVHVIP
jgi:hypothetical protein